MPGRSGAVLQRIHPNADGQRYRGKRLCRRLGVESEPEKRDAITNSALKFYMQDQNLLMPAAAGEWTTGVDRQ
jgi:hypothetical protein